jgi:hypothetical protein
MSDVVKTKNRQGMRDTNLIKENQIWEPFSCLSKIKYLLAFMKIN